MTDPTNPLLSQAVAGIAPEVFRTAAAGITSAEKWLKGKISETDPLGLAARRYAKRFRDNYRWMRVFGMAKPIPLRRLYVPMSVFERAEQTEKRVREEYKGRGKQELEQYLARETAFHHLGKAQKSPSRILAGNRRLVVLGQPGAGKTTMLKHLGFAALAGKINPRRLPVFVGLKRWNDSGQSLFKSICDEFAACDFNDPTPFVNRLLTSGHCLLLLDGLDEMTRDADEGYARLSQFVREFPDCSFVLSCRVAAYREQIDSSFSDLEVAPFSRRQITSFVNNFFEDASVAEACSAALAQDRATQELATNPLLLTLICLAFQESLELPSNRSELYKESIDALLKRWDSSRGIKRRSVYGRLTVQKKEALLSRIAVKTFEDGEYFFQRRKAAHIAASYLDVLAVSGARPSEAPDAEDVLEEIMAHHGLLVTRERDLLSFSHLTIHEYLAARYVKEHEAKGAVASLVARHALDQRWREVIILTAGMLIEADSIVLALEQAMTEVRSGAQFIQVLRWLTSCEELLGAGSITRKSLRSGAGELAGLLAAWLPQVRYIGPTSSWPPLLKHLGQPTTEVVDTTSLLLERLATLYALLISIKRAECLLTPSARRLIDETTGSWFEIRRRFDQLGDRVAAAWASDHP